MSVDDEIRKIVREEIAEAFRKHNIFAPSTPAFGPQESLTTCPVCRIDFGNGPWGYVCNRVGCPQGTVTAGPLT